MTFPDTIERTLELAQPPERVWAALTTADGLGTWFGHRAEVDLRVGGRSGSPGTAATPPPSPSSGSSRRPS